MAAAHGGRDAHESAASSSSGSGSGSGKIECNTLFHHQTVFSCCSLPLLPVFAQGEVSTSTDPVDTTRARSVTSVKQRNKKCMPPARPSHQAQKHNPVFPLSREPGLRVCAIPSPAQPIYTFLFPLVCLLFCRVCSSVRSGGSFRCFLASAYAAT